MLKIGVFVWLTVNCIIKFVSLPGFLRLYHFYGLFTAYLLYEEVMSMFHWILLPDLVICHMKPFGLRVLTTLLSIEGWPPAICAHPMQLASWN